MSSNSIIQKKDHDDKKVNVTISGNKKAEIQINN